MLKTLAFSALAFFALSLAPAFAEGPSQPRLLTLNGHGEVKSAPDMAVIDLGTVSQGATVKAALEANTAKMTALITMLKSAGIDDKDIQTSNFSLSPRYDNSSASSSNPKIIGYEVRNSVSVMVHKLPDVGALLDKAVASGSNQVEGINFGLENAQAAQDEARKAAVKDALRKAGLLTEAAGVKLGPIVTLNEAGSYAPVPMTKMARMQADGAVMAASAPVPVAEGQLAITADVSMVWELQ